MIIGFIANLLAYVMKPKLAAWAARGLCRARDRW